MRLLQVNLVVQCLICSVNYPPFFYCYKIVDYKLCFQVSLLEESIKPRANLPPLLVHLRERHPEKLHYIGVSFGLTQDLFRFWRKLNFTPFYIGQIPVSNATSPIMVIQLKNVLKFL